MASPPLLKPVMMAMLLMAEADVMIVRVYSKAGHVLLELHTHAHIPTWTESEQPMQKSEMMATISIQVMDALILVSLRLTGHALTICLVKVYESGYEEMVNGTQTLKNVMIATMRVVMDVQMNAKLKTHINV